MHKNSHLLRLKHWWLAHEWAGTLLVFCVAIIAYTAWIASPTFADPDSFYHIKIAEIIGNRRQAIQEFPWLPFTTLSEQYVDHHFLYHVFLVPFLRVFDSFIGMKVATILLAATTVTLFYAVLRKLHIRYAVLFSALLLFNYSFSFRMGLSKTPSIAFLFLMTGFFLLLQKHNRMLIPLSFLFVWTYGGFLLLPILGVIYCTIDYIYNRNSFRKTFTPLFAIIGGTVAGLLIHPSFPHHLQFYWEQIVQIGLVNYQGIVSVGGEWYPAKLYDIIQNTLLVFVLFLAAIINYIRSYAKQRTASTTALIMAALFFLFTLKSRRYIEFAVPWMLVFSVLSFHASGVLDNIAHTLHSWRKIFALSTHKKIAVGLIGTYLVVIIPTVVIQSSTRLYANLHGGIPVNTYAKGGAWLRSHATKGDVIFHADWDEFPILFYQAARGRYIAGLDPTFFYLAQPEKYTQWRGITKGEISENLYTIIAEDFGARFVLLDHTHPEMLKNIQTDERFQLAYEDDELFIFRISRHENSLEK